MNESSPQDTSSAFSFHEDDSSSDSSDSKSIFPVKNIDASNSQAFLLSTPFFSIPTLLKIMSGSQNRISPELEEPVFVNSPRIRGTIVPKRYTATVIKGNLQDDEEIEDEDSILSLNDETSEASNIEASPIEDQDDSSSLNFDKSAFSTNDERFYSAEEPEYPKQGTNMRHVTEFDMRDDVTVACCSLL